MHRNDIHISFDKNALVVLYNGLLGLVKSVELIAFLVDERLGRVDIFGDILFQSSAAECYHFA